VKIGDQRTKVTSHLIEENKGKMSFFILENTFATAREHICNSSNNKNWWSPNKHGKDRSPNKDGNDKVGASQ
jgi:hypothetical protein